jgi:hypothetical protein
MVPDPWEKAADCERAMRATIDPQRQELLERLRNLWIGLGNKQGLMTEDQLAMDIEAISRLHARLTAH